VETVTVSRPVDMSIIQLKGMKLHVATLRTMLPDIETALFFGKVFELDEQDLNIVLSSLFRSSVLTALTQEATLHSSDLQDYVVELGYENLIELGEIAFAPAAPHAEILPAMWEMAQVDVAKSIKDVAEKLKDVVSAMPGKHGQMMFQSMMKLNARRPIIGDYRASIKHARQAKNLVILDVSGSMSQHTVSTIIDDVVALSWEANASLAIVSNTATIWQPGEYDSNVVLKAAEFGGTHYETLSALLEEDWGVVVTIADYDSSASAKTALAKCKGSIELVLDISLVNTPTFLAECVGQRALEVRPLLVGNSTAVLH
jgi:hypothetical protein